MDPGNTQRGRSMRGPHKSEELREVPITKDKTGNKKMVSKQQNQQWEGASVRSRENPWVRA